jgi:hypothetical protein
VKERFRYAKSQAVKAKNLPFSLLDYGFKNGDKYLVKFAWVERNTKQMYYVANGSKAIYVQNADGICTGYAQFFEPLR